MKARFLFLMRTLYSPCEWGILWTHKISFYWREDEEIDKRSGRSSGCSWTGKNLHGQNKERHICSIWKGQKVWLDSQNLKTLYHKKIRPKQEGPFEIDEVLGPVTYWLKLLETWKIHNVFHVVLLQPYTETEAHGNNYPKPPPDLLEGEEVYTIELILKHWCRGQGYQYYILWEGYPITEASWELELAFSTDGDMLALYKQWHQLPWNTSLNGNEWPQLHHVQYLWIVWWLLLQHGPYHLGYKNECSLNSGRTRNPHFWSSQNYE